MSGQLGMVYPNAVCRVEEGLDHGVGPVITTIVRDRQPVLNPATRSHVRVIFFCYKYVKFSKVTIIVNCVIVLLCLYMYNIV